MNKAGLRSREVCQRGRRRMIAVMVLLSEIGTEILLTNFYFLSMMLTRKKVFAFVLDAVWQVVAVFFVGIAKSFKNWRSRRNLQL